MSSNVISSGPGTPARAESRSSDGVREVSRFIELLFKAIKNIQLYRHAKDRYPIFLEPAYAALQSLLTDRDGLRLELGPTMLEYGGQIVHTDETRESLIYKLYRDGVRILCFRSSIAPPDLLAFTLILAEAEQNRGSSADDMVVRLWKAELHAIEYIAVESFTVEEGKGSELDLERMVAHLQRQLAAHDDDVARIARFSAEDLEVDLEEIDVEVSRRAGAPAQPAQGLAAALAEEDELILPKLSLVIFNVIELDGCADDFVILDDALTSVFDSFLLAGNLRGAVALFRRLDELARSVVDEERKHLSARMLDALRARMVQRQRLDTLLAYLNQSSDIDVDGARGYLHVCTADQLELLMEHLSRMERSDRRELLIEALVEIGSTNIDLFVAQLQQHSVNRVRDMLAILQRIDAPVTSKVVAGCLAHENSAIRLEALKILAKSEEPEAKASVEVAMADENVRIRLVAYRALAHASSRRAFELLSKRISDPGYQSMEQRERIVIATVLGETQRAEALQLFAGLFRRRTTFFGRSRQMELRHLAVVGLEAMGTERAFHVLAQELKRHENGREIQEACRAAALRLKQKLTRSAA